MSTAEIGPQAVDHDVRAGRLDRVDVVDRTGPIGLPAGLSKPGAEDVAPIPGPRRPGTARHTRALGHATGPMAISDAALAAAAATNATAFAAIYRRYGDALHSFCLGMLRDPDAAADCVHDVFVTAATRLGQLREHDKLRPWLYAIARHEALRRLKTRKREQSTDEVPDTPDLTGGPEHDLARRELADLVTAATAGLSDRERAVLELHYRQGLDGPALADALGVSATNANTMVGRLRTTVERSLSALLVARHRADQCLELAGVLDGWDGTLTVLMRKRIARHIDHCPSCQAARRDLVNPRALLASAPVAIPAPDWLEHHVLADAAPLVEAAAVAPAGSAGVAAVATWWPAGLGAGTNTLVAVLAPVGAAVVAVPIVVLATLASPAEPTASTTVLADAPGVSSAPAPKVAPRFRYDMPTTRYTPTATNGGAPPTENAPTTSQVTPSEQAPRGGKAPALEAPVPRRGDGGVAPGGVAAPGEPQQPDGPRTGIPEQIKPTEAPDTIDEKLPDSNAGGGKAHTPPPRPKRKHR